MTSIHNRDDSTPWPKLSYILLEFPDLEKYIKTNKGNKVIKGLRGQAIYLTLAYFLKILPSVEIIVWPLDFD
jgi:hypothetical protein